MNSITKRTENIFRTISRNDPCYNLNKTLLPNFYPHDCFYQMSENGYLVKYFSDHYLYRWELYVYNKLKEYEIVPEFVNYGKSVYTNMSAIGLDISNMISLRNYLNYKKFDKIMFVEELCSFIYKLRDFGIIHNNLTIDSIYIKTEIGAKPRFYIIEFINMKIKKKEDQTSCTKEEEDIDIFSLYNSLISYKNNDASPQTLSQTDHVYMKSNKSNDTVEYIKNTILEKFNLNSYDFIYKITDYYV